MVLLSMLPSPFVNVSQRIIMGLRLNGKVFWLTILTSGGTRRRLL
jgi:hypothetical protein